MVGDEREWLKRVGCMRLDDISLPWEFSGSKTV